MRQLLEWGADPNTRTSEGCTALHYAAYMGQPDCVTTLLRKTPTLPYLAPCQMHAVPELAWVACCPDMLYSSGGVSCS